MTDLIKSLNWIDLLAFGAVAFLVVRGFLRGCSGEVGRLVAVCAAAAAGFFGFAPVSRLVLAAKVFGANPAAGRLVVFILLCVVCIGLWLALSRLLADAIRLVVTQPWDALLGGVIGGLKAFVLVAVLCAFGMLQPGADARARFQEDSLAARRLAPVIKRFTHPDS